MSRKKTVLFFGEAASLAHVVRPLVLARSLHPGQYDVHFACDDRYRSLIGASPDVRHWPIRSIASDVLVANADRGNFPLSQDDLEVYIRDERELLNRLRPSLVISDLRFTVSISTELGRFRHAALTNAYWSPYRRLGFDPNPQLGPPLDCELSWQGREPGTRRSATEALNDARQRYGLPLIRGYCELASRGDYTLYAEPPGFVETAPMSPEHVFLGPVLWSPEVTKPPWWGAWDPGLPLIYVTLGSTGAAALVERLVRSLQEMPATIVVATAGRSELVGMKANVHVADYLPGAEICRLATVVVCNGGSPTGYQALSQGTPVVGLWSNVDQYLAGTAIERTGAGLCRRAIDVEGTEIRELVTAALVDPKMAITAGRLKEQWQRWDARQTFPEFVRNVID